MRVLLLLINFINSLRLLTLPPLDKSHYSIFIKNQNLHLKLEKATDKNIMDMYVVVHKRKIYFYNKGNYHGLTLSSDNITLELTPINLSQINYFSQDDKDDNKTMKVLKWNELIKKKKAEIAARKSNMKNDVKMANKHKAEDHDDNSNTLEKSMLLSRNSDLFKHIPHNDLNKTLLFGNQKKDKDDYNPNKSDKNILKKQLTLFGTSTEISEMQEQKPNEVCIETKSGKICEKDLKIENEQLNYNLMFKKLQDLMKSSDKMNEKISDSKINEKISDSKINEKINDLIKNRKGKDPYYNNEIESDSEMANSKSLDIFISVIDEKNKLFNLKDDRDLCVTYFQKSFIMAACSKSKKQIFKLINVEDVVKNFRGNGKSKNSLILNNHKEEFNLSSSEMDEMNGFETNSSKKLNKKKDIKNDWENKDIKKLKKNKKNDLTSDNEETERQYKSDKRAAINIPEEEKKSSKRTKKKHKSNLKQDVSSESSESENEISKPGTNKSITDEDERSDKRYEQLDENNIKGKIKSRKKPSRKLKENSREYKVNKANPKIKDNPVNYGEIQKTMTNVLPKQNVKAYPYQNPNSLAEYCRISYNNSKGQINKLPPECQALPGFKIPAYPNIVNQPYNNPTTYPASPKSPIASPSKEELTKKEQEASSKNSSFNVFETLDEVFGA